jgi:hypothetical protein
MSNLFPLIVLIKDALELKIIRTIKYNGRREEELAFEVSKFNFKSLVSTKIDLSQFNKDQIFSGSKIYVEQSIDKEYAITSMILPWLFKYDEKNKKLFFNSVFYKILLAVMNFYYYIESAIAFRIANDTIFEKKDEIKKFKKLMFDLGREPKDQIFEHILNKVIHNVYELNTTIFCKLYDLLSIFGTMELILLI